MQQNVANVTQEQLAATLGAAIQADSALRSVGIRDAAELKPLVGFAHAAEEREAALSAYRKALTAHRRFAATHDADDPAHEDHQRMVATTHATLVASEQVLAVKLAEWRKARGL